MEMMINVVKAATELAHQDLRGNLYNSLSLSEEEIKEDWETALYKNSEAETFEYTEEWQDIFNQYYDYYFEIISGCSVGEPNKE